MEHVLDRLKTYSGDTLLILKQLIAVSIKLDIWDELILSVPMMLHGWGILKTS